MLVSRISRHTENNHTSDGAITKELKACFFKVEINFFVESKKFWEEKVKTEISLGISKLCIGRLRQSMLKIKGHCQLARGCGPRVAKFLIHNEES